jgi:hypothetical protein
MIVAFEDNYSTGKPTEMVFYLHRHQLAVSIVSTWKKFADPFAGSTISDVACEETSIHAGRSLPAQQPVRGLINWRHT